MDLSIQISRRNYEGISEKINELRDRGRLPEKITPGQFSKGIHGPISEEKQGKFYNFFLNMNFVNNQELLYKAYLEFLPNQLHSLENRHEFFSGSLSRLLREIL